MDMTSLSDAEMRDKECFLRRRNNKNQVIVYFKVIISARMVFPWVERPHDLFIHSVPIAS